MKEVIKYIENLKIKGNDNVICAVSGGPDSMALLLILKSLKDLYHFNIIVAHVNHHLRKESDKEERYIRDFCEQKGLIFEIYDYFPRDLKNLEAKARQARYEFFEKLIDKYNSKYLFTAHHSDDLIETILMKLVRGSTTNGYTGFKIEDKRDNYSLYRPLLLADKNQILKYLKDNKQKYFIDKTNKISLFTRNRYRLKIIPLLRKENPNINNSFLDYSLAIDEMNSYIDKKVDEIYNNIVLNNKINLEKFNNEDIVIKKKILERFLEEEYQSDIVEINKRHINLILSITDDYSGKKTIDMPFNKVIVREYKELYFYKENHYIKNEGILDKNKVFNMFKIYLDKDGNLDNNFVMRLSKKDVKLPLIIRTYKEDDTIFLNNLGTKKVKDIFKDSKVKEDIRKYYPIITDSNNKIIFIPGIKKSNLLKKKTDKYDIIITCELKEKL